MGLFPVLRLHCFLSLSPPFSFPLTSFPPMASFHPHISNSQSLYFPLHLLFSLFSCTWFFFLSGPGEQGPEQRKDLSDLSDSESGQDGPERDEQQEVHSGLEAAVRGGRYLKNSVDSFILLKGAIKLPIQVVKQHLDLLNWWSERFLSIVNIYESCFY